jgi:hypothetical protein
MDQQSICLFLIDKGLLAQTVHTELVSVLGSDAVAYSTITKYLRQRKFPSILCDTLEEPPTTVFDCSILDALERQSFSCVQELLKLTRIPTATVRRYLMRSFGFVAKHLRWILQCLMATQKAQLAPLSDD